MTPANIRVTQETHERFKQMAKEQKPKKLKFDDYINKLLDQDLILDKLKAER